jgi:hypothetical protein
VAGSAIYGAEDYQQAIDAMRKELSQVSWLSCFEWMN